MMVVLSLGHALKGLIYLSFFTFCYLWTGCWVFLAIFLTVQWEKKVDFLKIMIRFSILEKLGCYFLKDNFMVGR